MEFIEFCKCNSYFYFLHYFIFDAIKTICIYLTWNSD